MGLTLPAACTSVTHLEAGTCPARITKALIKTHTACIGALIGEVRNLLRESNSSGSDSQQLPLELLSRRMFQTSAIKAPMQVVWFLIRSLVVPTYSCS